MNTFIAYDITRLMHRYEASHATGIDRVDINYISWIINSFTNILFIKQQNKSFELVNHKEATLLLSELGQRWGCQEQISISTKTHLYQSFEDYLNNNNKILYINTSHTLTAQEELLRLSTRANFKSIFFIHDLIPASYPHFVRDNDEITFRNKMLVIFSCASIVITNSNYTKNEINNFCKENNISFPEIIIANIGCETIFHKATDIDRKNYFIYVSTLEPRKNHLLLIHVWELLAKKYQEQTPILIFIGKKGWNIDWLESYINKNPIARKYIKRIESVKDSLLAKLMQECLATLNPSHVEGWGMPAVESMAAQKITLCSDIPAYREATQGKAIYLHPDDTFSWFKTISQIIDKKIQQANINIKIPSWQDHFLIINKTIKKTINSAQTIQYTTNSHISSIKNLSNDSVIFLDTCILDMREEIWHGRNWYAAEENGRWFGPSDTGTLNIKNMKKGEYTITLDIAQEIIEGIAAHTHITYNKKELPVKYKKTHDTILEFDLTLEKNTNYTVLVLTNSNFVKPCSLDKSNDDFRKLSFMVKQVIIRKKKDMQEA